MRYLAIILLFCGLLPMLSAQEAAAPTLTDIWQQIEATGHLLPTDATLIYLPAGFQAEQWPELRDMHLENGTSNPKVVIYADRAFAQSATAQAISQLDYPLVYFPGPQLLTYCQGIAGDRNAYIIYTQEKTLRFLAIL